MKFSVKKLGKIGKMPNYQKILTNKYILYLVLFLSGMFLFSLLLAKKLNLIILYSLIGYIIWFYNKNMTIVLGLSLILTFIANLGVKVKEGMENESKDDNNDDDKNKTDDDKDKSDDTSNSTTTQTPSSTSSSSTNPTPTTSSKDGMNGMSIGKRNRIDYASTVEDAYDDLSKILGGDGIKRLTGDTQQLLEQQVQLVDAMKNMTPLIETAKGLLNGLNMDGLNGLTDIAQKLIPTK
jgi:ABC-type antimicrobial peptide transport system permease subunit